MTRASLVFALPFMAALVAGCGGEESVTDLLPGDGDFGGAGGGGGGDDASDALIENRYFLRLHDEATPDVVLDLDKTKALQLFGEQSRNIVVLDVDPTPLLTNVVGILRSACGGGWKGNQQSPKFDCKSTPVGKSFGPAWATSPEFALVRLLCMTPANANVRGTSLQDLAQLFEQNAQLFTIDFADVLSESLGIPKTAPIIPTDKLVAALQKQLLQSHPNVTPEGRLPVTLYDALNDLRTLPQLLGPADGHPGLLLPDDPSFTTSSDVLQPNFHMRVTAQSNLRLVDGIDLSDGAGQMFVSLAEAPLSFDFNDPNRLVVSGVTASPTVDMRLIIREFPTFVPACAGSETCKANLPPPLGFPIAGTVWSIPPYYMEPVIAQAGFLTYQGRSFEKCYVKLGALCLTGVSIGGMGNPGGWTIFVSDFQSVYVPPPQYLWELLMEVGEHVLHDPTGDGVADIPEGLANPVLPLRDVGLGLSGQEIVAQMRPNLQAQAGEIANIVLGRYWENSDPVDFFYWRADPGGPPYLFFVAESDLRRDPENPNQPKPYDYTHQGFYTDPSFSKKSKVSSRVIPGVDDTAHEKYRLSPGETTLYMQDDEERVYRVTFTVPENEDPTEIVARVDEL